MNPSDEQDELWDLLGRARQSRVSPFFARNVVREIRTASQDHAGWLGVLTRHWRWATMSAVFGCFVMVTAWQFAGKVSQTRQIESLVAITEEITASPDFYVINDLDDLLASEENSVWLDNSVQ